MRVPSYRSPYCSPYRSPSRIRHRAALLALLPLLGVLGACDSDKPDASPTSAPPTPIERLDTASMRLPRIDFCKLVPKPAIQRAVGATKFDGSSYGNGDTTEVRTGARDVVHEIDCTYTSSADAAAVPSDSGSTSPTPSPSSSATSATLVPGTARAWLFGSPVDATLARTAVRDARTEKGCRVVTNAARFGDPTLRQTCHRPGNTVRVRYAGLFGDTWFSCEVSAAEPADQVQQRAGSWCVSVVSVLRTSR